MNHPGRDLRVSWRAAARQIGIPRVTVSPPPAQSPARTQQWRALCVGVERRHGLVSQVVPAWPPAAASMFRVGSQLLRIPPQLDLLSL